MPTASKIPDDEPIMKAWRKFQTESNVAADPWQCFWAGWTSARKDMADRDDQTAAPLIIREEVSSVDIDGLVRRVTSIERRVERVAERVQGVESRIRAAERQEAEDHAGVHERIDALEENLKERVGELEARANLSERWQGRIWARLEQRVSVEVWRCAECGNTYLDGPTVTDPGCVRCGGPLEKNAREDLTSLTERVEALHEVTLDVLRRLSHLEDSEPIDERDERDILDNSPPPKCFPDVRVRETMDERDERLMDEHRDAASLVGSLEVRLRDAMEKVAEYENAEKSAQRAATYAEQAHHFHGMIDGFNAAFGLGLRSVVGNDWLGIETEDDERIAARERDAVVDIGALSFWVTGTLQAWMDEKDEP